MKTVVAALLLLVARASAFTVVTPSSGFSTKLFAEYEKMEGEGKINLKVSRF